MSELEIWNELGNIYYNAGAYDEAIRAYHRAIELDRGCGQSFINLADIYIRKQFFAEAILMYQKGIELLKSPLDQAALWNRLGEVYLGQERYEEAWEAYQKAVDLDPDNEALKEDLAKVDLGSRTPVLTEPKVPVEGALVEAMAPEEPCIILPDWLMEPAEPVSELLPLETPVQADDPPVMEAAPAETITEPVAVEIPSAEPILLDDVVLDEEPQPDWFEPTLAEMVEEADPEPIPPLPEEFRAEAGGESTDIPAEPILVDNAIEAEPQEQITALQEDLPEADPILEDSDSPCWVFQSAGEFALVEAVPEAPVEKEPLVLGNRLLSEEPEFIPAAELPVEDVQVETASEMAPETVTVLVEPQPISEVQVIDMATDPEPADLQPISEVQLIDMSEDFSARIDQVTSPEPTTEIEPTMEEASLLAELEAEAAPEPAEPDFNEILASALPDDFQIPFRRQEDRRDLPFVEPRMAEPVCSRARALVKVGLLHWRRDDFEGALQFFDTAVNLAGVFFDHSFEALCYHAIGRVKADMGCVDEAIGAYSNAACLNPVDFSPWREIGLLYNRASRYEDALSAFRKAIEHDPKDPVSWNGLGDVYHKLGRPEDAISAYQLGNVFDNTLQAQANPASFDNGVETPRVLEEMGNIHFLHSDYDEAIHVYSDAIERLESPTEKARLWRRLGDAYQRLNEEDNARLAYHQAQDLDAAARSIQDSASAQAPDEAGPISRNFVEELIASAQAAAEGKEPEASAEPETLADEDDISEVEEPERILTFHVDPVPPFIEDEPEPELEPVLAAPQPATEPRPEPDYWYFKNSAPVQPEPQPAPEPEQTTATSPASTSVGTVRPVPSFILPKYSSQAALEKPLLTAACEDPEVMVLEDTPEDEIALQFEASILLEEETRPITAAELDSIQEETPQTRAEPAPAAVDPIDSPTPLEAGANLHTLNNDIATYRRVTEINPLNDRAWDALGNMYEATGLHSEAIAAFEKAISLASQREVYHYHLGLAHAAQKRYDKAIQSMQMVVALNPDYVLAHCALAGLYRRMGKEAEAREHMVIARPYMESENYYNQACFESICGNTDRAFAFLRNALDKGQVETELVQNDPDLDFIREDPRFRQLVNREEPVYQVVP